MIQHTYVWNNGTDGLSLPKDCKEEIRSKIVKIEYFFNDHWFQQAEKMTKYKPLLTIMSITIYVHTDSPLPSVLARNCKPSGTKV